MGKRIAFDCPLDQAGPHGNVRSERDVHVAIDGPDGRRCRSDIVKVRQGVSVNICSDMTLQ